MATRLGPWPLPLLLYIQCMHFLWVHDIKIYFPRLSVAWHSLKQAMMLRQRRLHSMVHGPWTRVTASDLQRHCGVGPLAVLLKHHRSYRKSIGKRSWRSTKPTCHVLHQGIFSQMQAILTETIKGRNSMPLFRWTGENSIQSNETNSKRCHREKQVGVECWLGRERIRCGVPLMKNCGTFLDPFWPAIYIVLPSILQTVDVGSSIPRLYSMPTSMEYELLWQYTTTVMTLTTLTTSAVS